MSPFLDTIQRWTTKKVTHSYDVVTQLKLIHMIKKLFKFIFLNILGVYEGPLEDATAKGGSKNF